MIIFLDIYGVLCSPIFIDDCSGYCQIERFEAVMRDYPDWEIVISSGMREKKSLSDLKELFSADIAARIVGVTPAIGLSIKHCGQHEIERYLYSIGKASAPWVALDDMASQFEDGLDNLVLCNMSAGLDENAALRLREKLTLRTNIAKFF
ncbi:MAG: HAD domain-containing protein [Gallionella sp.]|nr:HAD domain-containing protein [Gallionella sp.]